MSVLIKGVKKPKDCWECFDTWGKCMCIDFHVSGVHTELCPLVEIPTPHGRLIDADELLKRKGDAYDSGGHLLYAVGTGSIVVAPTIIEAEEGEEV